MNALSEWLQLMLAEIARKQDDSERARAEEARRAAEQRSPTPGRAEQPGG
jgi:protein involved in temperature-dependent protein secretion